MAEPGTITGSIGVIGGKYSFKGLYEKLGINKEIITRGEHADFYSNFSDYPSDEQEIVQKQIKEIYEDFVSKVARGREQLTKAEVDKVARGLVWTGRQAKEKGLVDELGGLSKALSIAQKQAGLENKAVEIVRLPKLPWIAHFFGNLRLLSAQRMTLFSEIFNTVGHSIGHTLDLKLINIIKKHRIFLMVPYEIKVGS